MVSRLVMWRTGYGKPGYHVMSALCQTTELVLAISISKSTRKSCCCYNTTKEIESEHNKDMVTLELEKAKKQLKLISIEALVRRKKKERAMTRKEAEKEREEADIEKESG
jgi:4-diphosphocytidyl-2C-methyl-D-erythritol kinase